MAEASEQAEVTTTTEEVTTTAAETTTEETTSTEETTTEREPGGKDPLEVARRIEFGKRKAAEERARVLQEENVRLQERARMLEEQQKAAPKATEPELTIERVEQGIRDGTVDSVIGQRWIARKEAELFYQAQEQKRAQTETRTRIESEVNEYMKEIPGLRDRASKEFQAAEAEFGRLVQYGFDKDDPKTMHTAIRLAHGSLDKFQKQREANQLTRETLRPHTEAPSGGTRDQSTRTVDVNKAPDDLKAVWAAAGTSAQDKLKEYQFYLKRQTQRQRAR